MHLTTWSRKTCALVRRFCCGCSNELTYRRVCDWDGCATETKAFLMVQQCEYVCLCQYVDKERAVVGKATPEVLIPCVCYIGLSSWAQRACPWQRTHRHNTVLCWNWVGEKLSGENWRWEVNELQLTERRKKETFFSRRWVGRERMYKWDKDKKQKNQGQKKNYSNNKFKFGLFCSSSVT